MAWRINLFHHIQTISGGTQANVLESVLTSRRGPISAYGVEIVRNTQNRRALTGYGFTEKSRTLNAPISSIIGNCTRLPNEWSLLITFKPGGISSSSQYILTVLETNNHRDARSFTLSFDSDLFRRLFNIPIILSELVNKNQAGRAATLESDLFRLRRARIRTAEIIPTRPPARHSS